MGLIAALAACGKPDPVANGANAVAAIPATDKAAATPDGRAAGRGTGSPPRPRPPRATPIPAALQGRWGLTPGDCTSALGDAKGLLVINGRELRFYKSRAVPSPGVAADSDSIARQFRLYGRRTELDEVRNL